MPYLQLDIPAEYPLATKRALAKRLGSLYGEIMETTPEIVNVAFRTLGEGNVWSCDGPTPSAVLTCAIRRGRPPEQRARLAAALVGACAEALAWDPLLLTVEFQQHAGDEIYRTVLLEGKPYGSLGQDWTPAEAEQPLFDRMRAEALAVQH